MQSPVVRPKPRDGQPEWKRALEENVLYLQENLLLTDTIYAHLIQEKILTFEIVEVIKTSSGSDSGRVMEFVRCLKRRSDECFDRFLRVLDVTGNTFVADRLEQSMKHSRQSSISETEHELLMQAKDQRIRQLEEDLESKERQVKELEAVANEHKLHAESSLRLLEEELQTSQKYQRLYKQVIEHVRKMNSKEQVVQQQLVNKDVELQDMIKHIEELDLTNKSLEQQLNETREELETREGEMQDILTRECEFKRRLGLPEDATDREVNECINQLVNNNKSELRRAQDEIYKISKEKMHLKETISSLCHEKDKLEFDLRQKEVQLKRLRRTRDEHMDLQLVRGYTSVHDLAKPMPKAGRQYSAVGKLGFPAIIDLKPNQIISARLPKDPTKFKPSVSNYGNYSKAWQGAITSREPRETKYCLLCRRNYYLKNDCLIHLEQIRNGRYPCCGSEGSSTNVGCKTVNHLYIFFTGVDNNYIFYDELNRQLDFKEP